MQFFRCIPVSQHMNMEIDAHIVEKLKNDRYALGFSINVLTKDHRGIGLYLELIFCYIHISIHDVRHYDDERFNYKSPHS